MDGNFRQGRPKFSQGIIPGQPGEKKSSPTSQLQQQSRVFSGGSEETQEAGSESESSSERGARLWGSWAAEKDVSMTCLTSLCSPAVLAQTERDAMDA